MAEPPVSRQAKDILLKRVASVLGDALARRFELDLPGIVAHIPSDLPVVEVRAQYPDLLFLLADGSLLLLELQSQYTLEHVLRFGDYTWSAYRAHGRKVHTVVLYGPDARVPVSTVDAGSMQLTVTNILLGEQDAEQGLQRLTAKVARAEPITAVDRIDLVLTPLMRQRRPLADVIHDLLPLVTALPDNEQGETVGTIVGLAYHYLDEDTASALLEGLKMVNKLEEMIAVGIEQGRSEGIEQGEREAIRTVVRARFGAVPPALEARIASANDAALTELLSRAAKAAVVEAI